MDVNLCGPNRYPYVVGGEIQLSERRPPHRLHKPTLRALEILSAQILCFAIKITKPETLHMEVMLSGITQGILPAYKFYLKIFILE